MKFMYPMFFIGAMFGVGIVASEYDAVDYDLVRLSLRGGTKLYHQPYDEAVSIDSPRSSSSSLSERSEQSLCLFSYDDEERNPLLSSDEASSYSDDFESESDADFTFDQLERNREHANMMKSLMNDVGDASRPIQRALVIDEHICNMASTLIDTMREDIRLKQRELERRYQTEIDDDRDDL